MKKCTACGEPKSIDDFHNDKNRRDSKAYICKPCMKAHVVTWGRSPRGKEKAKVNRRKYRVSKKGKSKEKAFTQKPEQVRKTFAVVIGRHGIDVEDWARLYEKQRHRCAVCLCPLGIDRKTHVDHCRKTGRVRGLLCFNCNGALGQVKDSIAVLESLIFYLEKTK